MCFQLCFAFHKVKNVNLELCSRLLKTFKLSHQKSDLFQLILPTCFALVQESGLNIWVIHQKRGAWDSILPWALLRKEKWPAECLIAVLAKACRGFRSLLSSLLALLFGGIWGTPSAELWPGAAGVPFGLLPGAQLRKENARCYEGMVLSLFIWVMLHLHVLTQWNWGSIP